ncbi:MAG: nucleotide sugar dehydrogenase [Patescibacteria group bacterium]
MKLDELKIAIVGLGYVGLPLAVEFGKQLPIIGFDINGTRINELKNGIDRSGEISTEELSKANVAYTDDPNELKKVNFIIVAVPTPIDNNFQPDLKPLQEASKIVGENLSTGSIVVYESTVYPGVTEDVCGPILEQYSHQKCGVDFKLGYSPERINPGDKQFTVEKVIKIVSGQDKATLDIVADVYKKICIAGIHPAPSIKVAEAAKLIENVQRDLNIALANELSLIFHSLNINTWDVLEAAGTKWNFHKYVPGLVGGHCIGVDPYYLTHLSTKIGHNPELILTARRINEYMAIHVADMMTKGLNEANKTLAGANVLVAGLTFKENVKDIRNSKAKNIISRLKSVGINVYGFDPFLNDEEIRSFGAEPILKLELIPKKIDGIIICLIHDEFKALSLDQVKKTSNGKLVMVDIKGLFRKTIKHNNDFVYQTL